MASESIKFVNHTLSLADGSPTFCSLFSKKNQCIYFLCLWPYELPTDKSFLDLTLKAKPVMNTLWVSLGLGPKFSFFLLYFIYFFSSEKHLQNER